MGANNSLSGLQQGLQALNQQQQQAAQNQAGLGNYTVTGSCYTTSYPTTTTGGTYVGNGYITYPGNQFVVWPQTQAEPPTKAEQWVFQRAILHAELKNFCTGLIWKSVVLALWTNGAYSLATIICATKPTIGTTLMIFGLIPLMALAAKQRILQWGDRFLG